MKRKRPWRTDSTPTTPQYWEESWGILATGVSRESIQPPIEENFIRELGARAWRAFGDYWNSNKRAFVELDKLSPDGMEAMARFCSRHLLKNLPESGITEPIFWDEYMLYMVRMDHQALEQDETFTAYLKSRIGKPGWEYYLKRVIKTLDGKESPEFSNRFVFCMLWDLYPMPLKFWTDAAAVALLSGISSGFNLDKIRNMRRELGLNRKSPIIVKSFVRKPPKIAGQTGMLKIEIDDCMAEKYGLSALVLPFCEYLKGNGKLGS